MYNKRHPKIKHCHLRCFRVVSTGTMIIFSYWHVKSRLKFSTACRCAQSSTALALLIFVFKNKYF
jgi:hypothetical protein